MTDERSRGKSLHARDGQGGSEPPDARGPFPSLAAGVVCDHREWMERHRDLSVSDLRARIELALAQCREVVLAGDPWADEPGDLPEPLAGEMALWPESAERGSERFSDRGALLAGFHWRVTLLEQIAGDRTIGGLLDEVDGAA